MGVSRLILAQMEVTQLKNFEFAISINLKADRVTFIEVWQLRPAPLIIDIYRLSAVLGIYKAVVGIVSDFPMSPPLIVCGILIALPIGVIHLRLGVLREKRGDCN